MSLGGVSFRRPTASFSRTPQASLRFPLFSRGSSQGAKCAPAGRPGAGRGSALHVSGLPGGSPQPSEPLIGFGTGAYLGPRASFGLLGAESGDCLTMAPVHGDDCELGTSGERRALLGASGWECGGRGMMEWGGGSLLLILPKVACSRTAPQVSLAGDFNLSGRRPSGLPRGATG